MKLCFDLFDPSLYFREYFIHIILVIGVRLTIGAVAQDFQFLQNGICPKSSQTLEPIFRCFIFIYFF